MMTHRPQSMSAGAAGLLLALHAGVAPAQGAGPAPTGEGAAQLFAARAKALAGTLNGNREAATAYPSALDVLLGRGGGQQPPAAAPVSASSAAAVKQLLAAPGCSRHVAAAAGQLLAFAQTVMKGVEQNPAAAEFLQVQKSLGLDANALLRTAAERMRLLGIQPTAAGRPTEDINAEVARCLQASELANQAKALLGSIPGRPALFPENGGGELAAVGRVASWSQPAR